MKRSFLLIGLALVPSFFIQTKLYSQCDNLNFSRGNFTNWQAYMGTWGSSDNISPTSPTPGRHEIMSTDLMLTNQFYDEMCPAIPKVPNGFNYAAKLGNTDVNAQMEALEYTMTVDSNNSLLILHFAFVLALPNHSISEQPRFTMILKDSLGREMPSIPCSKVVFPAISGDPDLECDVPGDNGFVARNWTTVAFSLEPYMGKTIKIYYETRDCSQTGHFGYAYLVAECRPMRIELQFCAGQTAARMSAPVGFIKYRWTRSKNPNWFKEGGPEMRQIVEPQPQEGDIYTCEMTSPLGSNCSAQVKTEIRRTDIASKFYYGVKDKKGNVDFEPDYIDWYDTCARTATFVEFITVHNSTKAAILWEVMDPKDPSGKSVLKTATDSMFTYTFPDPDSTPVTYRVRLTGIAENGCTDTNKLVKTITIFPSPKIKIDGRTEICTVNDSIALEAKKVRSVFVSHRWTNEKGTLLGTGNILTVYYPGTYIVESTDIAGCVARDTIVITPLKPKFEYLYITDVSCYGDSSGIFIHGPIINGAPPYNPFYWIFNGSDTIRPQTYMQGMYSDLKAGVCFFEAVDANGCFMRGEVEIKQISPLKISGVQYPTTCGENNGKLKLFATGGLTPYTFEIKDQGGNIIPLIGKDKDSAINLSAGVYKITVSDNTNRDGIPSKSPFCDNITTYPKPDTCRTTIEIEVKETPIPRLGKKQVNMESCEMKNGNIVMSQVNGAPTVKYIFRNDKGDTMDINNIGILSGPKNPIKGDRDYYVTLVDGNGCVDTMTVNVPSYPPIFATVATTPERCDRSDGSIILTVAARPPLPSGSTGGDKDTSNTVKYKWDGLPDTTSALIGIKAGTYKVTVGDGTCTWDTTIIIAYINGPVANFESNSYNVASNTIFILTDDSRGTVRTWDWDMGDGNTQNGKLVYYTYPKTGDYVVFLEVTDENQCIDTISKVIHIYDELNVFIPNMFTPNGDGLNDKWKPVMSEYAKEGYQMSIFDRWGQRVFHTTNTEDTWDGTVKGKKVAPNTVYSYRVIVRDFTGQEFEFIGHVTVLE